MLNTSVSFVQLIPCSCNSFGLIYIFWILYLSFSSNEIIILEYILEYNYKNCIDIITELYTYYSFNLRSSSMTKIKNQLREQTENI